ncbi:hypothetical protein ACFL9U_17595, partial [Thermodesulfobacteriota bacterium]
LKRSDSHTDPNRITLETSGTPFGHQRLHFSETTAREKRLMGSLLTACMVHRMVFISYNLLKYRR